MPAEYLRMRDKCYRDKRAKNNGKLSDKSKKECQKWAAIQYWKKTGKAPSHGEVNIIEMFLNEFSRKG